MAYTYAEFHEIRLYIGPDFRPRTFTRHYDWSIHDAEAADDLDVETTLTATLGAGVTASLSVASAAGLADKGGVWVGPNGAGQGWEQVQYGNVDGNSLEDLQREARPPATHNGIHTSGAVVRPFLLVTGDNGQLHIQRAADENNLTTSWTATVAGVLAPESILRNGRVAIVQHRSAANGTWTNLLVGFLDSPRLRDDAARRGEWTVQIVSLAGVLDRLEVDGLRVGNYDLATAGSTASNTPLPSVAAYKERQSGDYTAASPDFSSDNVITPDADAPWISDRYTGSVVTPATGNTYNGVAQLYLNPPYAAGGGLKWIEILHRVTSGSILALWDTEAEAERLLEIPSMNLAAQETLILCEQEDRFRLHNPTASPTRLYAIEDSDDPSWFDYLKPEGGALAFKSFDQYDNIILWGTMTEPPDDWDITPSAFGSGPIDAPGVDETIHYNFPAVGSLPVPGDPPGRNVNMQAEYFDVGKFQNPGYVVNAVGDDTWLAVFLPPLGLRLRDDITDSSPGADDLLYIVNDSGPSVDGLPASGAIWVGDEKIAYSAKSGVEAVIVSERGADGTVASSHVESDAILVDFEGEPVDCPPIYEIVWERDGTIVPADFVVRLSSQEARTPDQHLHENDYPFVAAYTGNTADTDTIAISDSYRYVKTVLFEFQVMSEDPARPRMNRIRAHAHPDYYDATRWLSGTRTVAETAQQLLLNAGVPADAVIDNGGTVELTDQETAKDFALNVLRDLALMTDTKMTIGLASKVRILPGDYWASATDVVAEVEWDEETIASYERVWTRGGQTSQVRIHWTLPDGSGGGTAEYPASAAAGWQGTVLELEGHIFVDEDAANAAARRKWLRSRWPYTSVIEAADGSLDYLPLDFHAVTWEAGAVVSGDDLPDDERLYLVSGVDITIADGVLSCVLQGSEIERGEEFA